MPKQIKKRVLKKGEKTSAVLCILAMAAGLIFAVLFIVMIPGLDQEENQAQKVKAILAAAGYVIFVGLTAAAMITSLSAYRTSKQMGDVMRGFFAGASIFTALLSIRFMLALFFAGLDDQAAVDKIIGSGSYSDFIQNQAPSFACLVIALAVMLFAGISAIVKLAKR